MEIFHKYVRPYQSLFKPPNRLLYIRENIVCHSTSWNSLAYWKLGTIVSFEILDASSIHQSEKTTEANGLNLSSLVTPSVVVFWFPTVCLYQIIPELVSPNNIRQICTKYDGITPIVLKSSPVSTEAPLETSSFLLLPSHVYAPSAVVSDSPDSSSSLSSANFIKGEDERNSEYDAFPWIDEVYQAWTFIKVVFVSNIIEVNGYSEENGDCTPSLDKKSNITEWLSKLVTGRLLRPSVPRGILTAKLPFIACLVENRPELSAKKGETQKSSEKSKRKASMNSQVIIWGFRNGNHTPLELLGLLSRCGVSIIHEFAKLLPLPFRPASSVKSETYRDSLSSFLLGISSNFQSSHSQMIDVFGASTSAKCEEVLPRTVHSSASSKHSTPNIVPFSIFSSRMSFPIGISHSFPISQEIHPHYSPFQIMSIIDTHLPNEVWPMPCSTSPLTEAIWDAAFQGPERILQESDFISSMEKMFCGGVESSIRADTWAHLLSIYTPGMSNRERASETEKYLDIYFRLSNQLELMFPEQLSYHYAARQAFQAIEKDLPRTFGIRWEDDPLETFQGTESGGSKNISPSPTVSSSPSLSSINLSNILDHVLKCYACFHMDVGYTQGMNDLGIVVVRVFSDPSCRFTQRILPYIKSYREKFKVNSSSKNIFSISSKMFIRDWLAGSSEKLAHASSVTYNDLNVFQDTPPSLSSNTPPSSNTMSECPLFEPCQTHVLNDQLDSPPQNVMTPEVISGLTDSGGVEKNVSRKVANEMNCPFSLVYLSDPVSNKEDETLNSFPEVMSGLSLSKSTVAPFASPELEDWDNKNLNLPLPIDCELFFSEEKQAIQESYLTPWEEAASVGAFMLFCAIMDQKGRVLLTADNVETRMSDRTEAVMALMLHLTPSLYYYLISQKTTDLMFCFRWLFVMFKREFSLSEVPLIWDSIFSCPFSDHFEIFIVLALLRSLGEKIITEKMGREELCELIQKLQGRLSAQKCIERAREVHRIIAQQLFWETYYEGRLTQSFTRKEEKITSGGSSENTFKWPSQSKEFTITGNPTQRISLARRRSKCTNAPLVDLPYMLAPYL